MNIMEFSSKTWKYICAGIAAACVVLMLCMGFRHHKVISEFEKEQIELQDSILSLREDIVAREEATVAAEQALVEARNNHIVETKLLQAELAKVRKNYRETLAEMADLDTSELKTYFAERYGQCADTVADSARFLLTIDAGNHIRYDLTDLDFCNEETKWQDSIITEQSRYIANLDTTVSILSVEKSYYMNKADSFEQQFNTSEQVRAGLEKSLSKAQTLNYIIGGTAAIIAVGFIATMLMPR